MVPSQGYHHFPYYARTGDWGWQTNAFQIVIVVNDFRGVGASY